MTNFMDDAQDIQDDVVVNYAGMHGSGSVIDLGEIGSPEGIMAALDALNTRMCELMSEDEWEGPRADFVSTWMCDLIEKAYFHD